MLRHKLIDRVCCVILALTLLVSAMFVGAAVTGKVTEDTTIGYETRLFDQSRVHTIDIVMDDWDAFISTATSEEYSACHLVIDGESYKNVAIRGKGNTSLSSVQAYGNNRYSFKVEFDHYQNGHTYHGLDKLSLNNLIQDNTYMKDYFAYTLMNKMGVAAPLCSFVQINVNGESWGLYLAVEGVEDAFLQRNYGKAHGELYKPDSMSFGGGRGNGRDFDMDDAAEKFGFDFGRNDSSAAGIPAAPENDALPAGDDSFGGSAGGSAGESSGESSGGQAAPPPTATPAPTATPTPAAEDSFGGSVGAGASDGTSAGDGASNGDAASSGMPADGMPPEGFDPNQMYASNGEAAATPVPAAEATPSSTFADRTMPEGFTPPDMGNGGFGGFGSSTDVKLQYTDDDPASYSNIFGNAKTDINAADQKRLIASLKALGEGNTSVVDTDAVIRYMAVHNFLQNDDSYTGMMIHNYYLYEEDGVLSMIPWDYNLAYGTMSGNNATSSVNADIDALVSMGNSNDRPMASWITSSDEYMAQYRAIYQEFMTTVFDSGWFTREIDRVIAMIASYVQADPTAFCTYEQFITGTKTIKAFCLKRAQSVSNQLDGSDARVDASELTLSDMGTMNGMGGGMQPGGFGSERNRDRKPFGDAEATDADAANAMREESPVLSFNAMLPGRSQTVSSKTVTLWLGSCILLLLLSIALVQGWKNYR